MSRRSNRQVDSTENFEIIEQNWKKLSWMTSSEFCLSNLWFNYFENLKMTSDDLSRILKQWSASEIILKYLLCDKRRF